MPQQNGDTELGHHQRVRERAYRLWTQEGCPEGRAEAHWDMACELVAIEDSQKDTLKPRPGEAHDRSQTGEPVEPLEAARNMGEFPTLTDQGEEATFPDRRNIPQANTPPMTPGRTTGAAQTRRGPRR